MDKKIDIYLFLDWLDEKDALYPYFKNIYNQSGDVTNTINDNWNISYEHIIDHSLSWSRTVEGVSYWSDMSRKWSNFCKGYDKRK